MADYGLADPLDNWHWRNPWPQEYSLRVSYGNGIFVAVGEFGALYTSADGANWTPRTSGTGHLLGDVAYGSGTFVAVGGSGTVLTSPDGEIWTPGMPGTSHNLSGVAFGSNTFVAVGENGAIATSPEGARWTGRDSGTHQFLKKVAFGNNIFVAVGGNGIIVTSSNGAAWTAQAASTRGHLEGIAYGNNTFVAVGEALLTSPDGIAWTIGGPTTNHHFFGVAYGSGTFAAVGNNGVIFTSPEGSVWTRRESTTHSSLFAIAHRDGSFFTSGEGGVLLQSDSLPSPRISVSPTSLDFGSVGVGKSSSKTLTITNSGSADLIVRRVTIDGTDAIDYISQNDQCLGTTLPPSQDCSLQVVFSPHSAGSKSATLSIASNDLDNPTRTVPLSGTSSGSGTSTNGSFCLITFVADGSGLERYIEILRKFRDVFLLENRPGKALVGFYYQHSPAPVNFVGRHDFLRKFLGWGLIPLMAIFYIALNTSPSEKALLFALIEGGMIVRFIICRRPNRRNPLPFLHESPSSPSSKIMQFRSHQPGRGEAGIEIAGRREFEGQDK